MRNPMRVQYHANAACSYFKDGFHLLADPWLSDTAFEGSWAHFPPLQTRIDDLPKIDLIFLSHLHPDHTDFETLAKLPKNQPILCLDDEGPNYLAKKLDQFGFKEVYLLKDGEKEQFGPLSITMFRPFVGHLFHDTQIGNILDSGILIESEGLKVLNLNDNAPTKEAAEKIFKTYGPIDLLQSVDSCAGEYPSCFLNLSSEDKYRERDRILNRHLQLFIECAKTMKARLVQPFAGHYRLIGRLMKTHQPYLAVMEPKEVAARFEAAGLQPLFLEEGDVYDLQTKKIEYAGFLKPSIEAWESKVKFAPYSYDTMPSLAEEELLTACEQAINRVYTKQQQLKCYPKCKIQIHAEGFRKDFSLHSEAIHTLQIHMPRRLLSAILTKRIHFNNAAVGCHIQFHRTGPYEPDAHLLMSYFHV